MSAKLTLSVLASPIDYSRTQVAWSTADSSGIIASMKTSEVFSYKLNFFDYLGNSMNLPADTPVTIVGS